MVVVLQRSQFADGRFSVNQSKCTSQLYLDFDAFSEADSKVTQLAFQVEARRWKTGPSALYSKKRLFGDAGTSGTIEKRTFFGCLALEKFFGEESINII